jgi:hypothetical protein
LDVGQSSKRKTDEGKSTEKERVEVKLFWMEVCMYCDGRDIEGLSSLRFHCNFGRRECVIDLAKNETIGMAQYIQKIRK